MTKAPTTERMEDEPPKDPGLPKGMTVGEYVIDRKIGEGAFGAVYSAEHPVIGKRAAIKVLSRRFSSDDEVVSRFVSEARAVNRIRHRNIVDIFAFGQLENGQHYLVMEFLEGSTLRDFIETRGVVSVDEALPLLRGVADALDAAHDQGIVHRDLKPDNVFLVRERKSEPVAKLLDFGVAKLQRENSSHKTATGIAVGTPLYMSPEQCRGRSVDHRSDIYAFGAMIYEMLTGQPPFDGETVMDIMVKHMNEPAQAMSRVAPHLPRELDDPVLVMLAKKAAARPASAGLALASLVEAARRAGSTVPKYEPTISSRVMELVQSEGAKFPNANVETKKVAIGQEIDLPAPEVPSLRGAVTPEHGDLGVAATRAATPSAPFPSIIGKTTAPISSETKPLDVELATPHKLPRRTATPPTSEEPSAYPAQSARKHMTLEAIEAPMSSRSSSMTLRVAVAVGALAVGIGGVWLIQSMRQPKTSAAASQPSADPTVRRVEPTFQPAIGADPPAAPSIVAAAPSASASAAPSASAAVSVAAPVRPPQNPPTAKPPVTATPSSTDKGNLGQWN
ncbi:MAG: serine/threonine-protein kinase [Polyangiaceae bacterium]